MTRPAPDPQPAPAIAARSGLECIPAYTAGHPSGAADRLLRLASNESALGPSPAALAVFREQGRRIGAYPDSDAPALREALGQFHGLAVDSILCTAGSEEALRLLALAFTGPGDEVIISRHGFIVHRLAALVAGAKPVVVAEHDYRCDVDGMLAALTPATKLVFIANPGNPTGTCLPLREIRRLHAALPERVLLVIDAAYAEFTEGLDGYGSGLELVQEDADNVAVTRTFSKMYGLAGLRVGWTAADPRIIAVLHKVRPAFNVNIAAQAAAVAALRDREHVERSRALNDEWLARMQVKLRGLGLRTSESVCNFVLARFAGAEQARDCFRYLVNHGIMVRPVPEYGLDECLRISIGTGEANEMLLRRVAEFLPHQS